VFWVGRCLGVVLGVSLGVVVLFVKGGGFGEAGWQGGLGGFERAIWRKVRWQFVFLSLVSFFGRGKTEGQQKGGCGGSTYQRYPCAGDTTPSR
jgi:hypothetical protein